MEKRQLRSHPALLGEYRAAGNHVRRMAESYDDVILLVSEINVAPLPGPRMRELLDRVQMTRFLLARRQRHADEPRPVELGVSRDLPEIE